MKAARWNSNVNKINTMEVLLEQFELRLHGIDMVFVVSPCQRCESVGYESMWARTVPSHIETTSQAWAWEVSKGRGWTVSWFYRKMGE